MNSAAYARTGYDQAETSQGTPRRNEYRAFAGITHRMASAGKADRREFPKLAAALADNQRLWRLLAADVAQEGNGLSPALRARILYLAEFTRQHSQKVLRHTATVDVLVDVNTAIMRGLRGETGAG